MTGLGWSDFEEAGMRSEQLSWWKREIARGLHQPLNKRVVMESQSKKPQDLRITLRQRLEILGNYAKTKMAEQLKSVALIISYLVLFQTLVLGMEILHAGTIALGVVVIVVGLAFFMEGLVLGIMPLGETIGLRLPEKSPIAVVLFVAFVLGVGATFAEPAIGILKNAGIGVKPWEAPLLFLALNKYPQYLVWAVALGVGFVLLGMLRYLYGWSLSLHIRSCDMFVDPYWLGLCGSEDRLCVGTFMGLRSGHNRPCYSAPYIGPGNRCLSGGGSRGA